MVKLGTIKVLCVTKQCRQIFAGGPWTFLSTPLHVIQTVLALVVHHPDAALSAE